MTKAKLLGFILIGLLVFTTQGFAQEELEFTLQQTLCPGSPDEGRLPKIFDVDEDGDLDIMLSRLYLNDGSGYFTPASQGQGQDQVFGPMEGAFGNFNGDEYIDYIYDGDIYLNDPVNPGTFIYKSTIPDERYEVRDLNGDGIDDAVAFSSFGLVNIYMNNGNGTFTHSGNYNVNAYYGATVGDIDGDGDYDMVAQSWTGRAGGYSITVFENAGQGSFIKRDRYHGYITGGVRTYITDFNGDGHQDIVGVYNWSNFQFFFVGDGNFGFVKQYTYKAIKPVGKVISEFRDYDGDGDIDVLSTEVYLNNGSGGFSSAGGTGNIDGQIAWGDLDGDGDLDMVNGRVGDIYFASGLNEPPAAQCKNITIEADENCQASITPEDIDNGSYDPDEGDEITLSIDNAGPFGVGEYNVKLTVEDTEGESDSCFATVTVIDNTAPVPDLETLPTVTGQCQAEITTYPTATDNCAGIITGTTANPLTYTQQGTYTVTWTFDDGRGNTVVQEQTVIVKDTTAPSIASISANPNSLWPPNHKMVAVRVSVEASDNCDASPVSKIIAVESNEPVNGLGDGDTGPDWEITGDLTLNLRAERSGKGDGRVYTITVECSDAAGNTTTGTVTVVVPKSKKK